VSLFYFNEQEMTWQLGATEGPEVVCQELELPSIWESFLFNFLFFPPYGTGVLISFLSVHVVSNYGPVTQKDGVTTNRTRGLNWISLTGCSRSVSLSVAWLCWTTEEQVKCLGTTVPLPPDENCFIGKGNIHTNLLRDPNMHHDTLYSVFWGVNTEERFSTYYSETGELYDDANPTAASLIYKPKQNTRIRSDPSEQVF
jgi:hypothetical protein